MLIAQLGHITEIAATDWLEPNPRSPDRADSAAWISEVLDEPHSRDLLDGLLASLSGGSTSSEQLERPDLSGHSIRAAAARAIATLPLARRLS